MKREIKFRGQRKLNGNWVFGSYIYIGEDWCQIVPLGTEYDEITYDKMRVITESVGQYTGLKDKNGTEIYDGDIVKVEGKPYESKEPIVVTWGKKSFGWSLKYNCGKHYENNPLIKYYSLTSSKNIEVIGNVHENPELLSNEKG